MRKTIEICGVDVPMEANAATPRVYRRLFGSDLLATLNKAISKEGEVMNMDVFENLAFCLAKQAGEETDDIESWLAQFDSPTAVLDVIGEIMKLWRANEQTTVAAKKKVRQQTGK